MEYISTRGQSPELNFAAVVLAGLARDGGLYVPKVIPNISASLKQDPDTWAALGYCDLAVRIMLPFVQPSLSETELSALVEESYAGFDSPEITPLRTMEPGQILELFHGPTFAFKDLALQFLGNVFAHFLARSGGQLNIVGATSGDTGSAAIYAVRGRNNIRIFMLHPYGKVSPVQEQQMTTVLDDNVFNIAVDGNFDDCQSIVKTLFNDLNFRDELQLGAVNSINWARILAQTVYYFYAGLRFKQAHPHKALEFAVPTGNFGDVFAGYVARKMGLPIDRLIVATNENDILERVLRTGEYRPGRVTPSLSPAMDIQVSSNFERLLFDLCGHNGEKVSGFMSALAAEGGFEIDSIMRAQAAQFITAVRVERDETLATIARLAQQGISVDPHTAVGIAAALRLGLEQPICLATAHPAKFADAVVEATGHAPVAPAAIAALAVKPPRCDRLSRSADAVAQYIRERVG